MLGAPCSATKRNGQPCTAPRLAGSAYCFGHAPEAAEQRADARRRGGQGRATATRALKSLSPTAATIHAELVRLFEDVLAGKVAARVAEVAQGIAGQILAFEKFAAEQGEQRGLEERLAELERRLAVEAPATRGWRR